MGIELNAPHPIMSNSTWTTHIRKKKEIQYRRINLLVDSIGSCMATISTNYKEHINSSGLQTQDDIVKNNGASTLYVEIFHSDRSEERRVG